MLLGSANLSEWRNLYQGSGIHLDLAKQGEMDVRLLVTVMLIVGECLPEFLIRRPRVNTFVPTVSGLDVSLWCVCVCVVGVCGGVWLWWVFEAVQLIGVSVSCGGVCGRCRRAVVLLGRR